MALKIPVPMLLGGAALVGGLFLMSKKAKAAGPAAGGFSLANLDEPMVSMKAPNTTFLPATTPVRVSSAKLVLQPSAGGILDQDHIALLPTHNTSGSVYGNQSISFYVDANDAPLPGSSNATLEASMVSFDRGDPGALFVLKSAPSRYLFTYVRDPVLAASMAAKGPWALSPIQVGPSAFKLDPTPMPLPTPAAPAAPAAPAVPTDPSTAPAAAAPTTTSDLSNPSTPSTTALPGATTATASPMSLRKSA